MYIERSVSFLWLPSWNARLKHAAMVVALYFFNETQREYRFRYLSPKKKNAVAIHSTPFSILPCEFGSHATFSFYSFDESQLDASTTMQNHQTDWI